MRNSLRLLGAAAAGVLMSGGAVAETYPAAKEVALIDFTGTVDVEVGRGPVSAVVTQGGKEHPVDIYERDGALIIGGEKRPRNYKIYKEIDWRSDRENAFKIFLESYPRLVIKAPPGTDVDFDDCIAIVTAGDLDSDVVLKGGFIEAALGDLRSADIGIGSSGDVSVNNVTGLLNVAIGGSGDFKALSAKDAVLTIGGSGDIVVGPVAGDARIRIGGSGDVETGSVGGMLQATVSGSGDILTGAVAHGAELSIAGSGDIDVARVNGPVNVSIAGNGDILVSDGRAENLRVRIAGSGDFDFGGVATNLDASIIGSGMVKVADNKGSLSISGRGGEVIVGGRIVSRRD